MARPIWSRRFRDKSLGLPFVASHREELHMARMPCLALMLLAATLTLPGTAAADSSWLSNEAIWRLMDTCTRQAQKAYPDYTKEGHMQREAYRANCLRANNLPYAGSATPAAPLPPMQPAQQPLQQMQQTQQMQQLQQLQQLQQMQMPH
jgi:hypothetical protein